MEWNGNRPNNSAWPEGPGSHHHKDQTWTGATLTSPSHIQHQGVPPQLSRCGSSHPLPLKREIWKLSPRELQQLAQSHTAYKGESQTHVFFHFSFPEKDASPKCSGHWVTIKDAVHKSSGDQQRCSRGHREKTPGSPRLLRAAAKSLHY